MLVLQPRSEGRPARSLAPALPAPAPDRVSCNRGGTRGQEGAPARGGLRRGGRLPVPLPVPACWGRARAPRPWAAPAAGGGASLRQQPAVGAERRGQVRRAGAGAGAGAGGSVPPRAALPLPA